MRRFAKSCCGCTDDEDEMGCGEYGCEASMGKVARAVSLRYAAGKWKKLPRGWTDESFKKFWNTLTEANPDHPVTECITRMEGKIGDPGAFCAAAKDRIEGGDTSWRSEAARKRREGKK